MLSTRAADESWTSPSSQAAEKFSRKNLAVVAGSDATIGASGTGPDAQHQIVAIDRELLHRSIGVPVVRRLQFRLDTYGLDRMHRHAAGGQRGRHLEGDRRRRACRDLGHVAVAGRRREGEHGDVLEIALGRGQVAFEMLRPFHVQLRERRRSASPGRA